jgi:peptidoglycan/LPS O-acetylase OafA/YrhL
MKENTRNYWFVDFLTCLGVTAIFFCHTTHVLAGFHVIDYTTFPTAFTYGLEYFVLLFFILSAFKLTSSIVYERNENAFSYKRYILRRGISIMPIYWLAIIAYLVFRYYLRKAEWNSLNFWTYIENFFLLQGFDPSYNNVIVAGGWFLGCLSIYYLAAPFLVRFISSTQKGLYWVGMAFFIRYLLSLTSSSPWFGLSEDIWNDYLVHNFISCLPFFLLGILGFRLFEEKDTKLEWHDAFLLILLIIYVVYVNDIYSRYGLLFFALLGVFSLIKGPFTEKMKIAPFLSKGALGVYVFQMMLLRTMAMFFPYGEMNDLSKWWVTVGVVLLPLWGVSLLLYLSIVRPLLHASSKAFAKRTTK